MTPASCVQEWILQPLKEQASRLDSFPWQIMLSIQIGPVPLLYRGSSPNHHHLHSHPHPHEECCVTSHHLLPHVTAQIASRKPNILRGAHTGKTVLCNLANYMAMYKHCILTSDSTVSYRGGGQEFLPPPVTIFPTQKSWKSMVIILAIYLHVTEHMCHQNVVKKFRPRLHQQHSERMCIQNFPQGGGGECPQTPLVGTNSFRTLLSSCYHSVPPPSQSQWVKAAFYCGFVCAALSAMVCKGTLHSQKLEVDTPLSNTYPSFEMCAYFCKVSCYLMSRPLLNCRLLWQVHTQD